MVPMSMCKEVDHMKIRAMRNKDLIRLDSRVTKIGGIDLLNLIGGVQKAVVMYFFFRHIRDYWSKKAINRNYPVRYDSFKYRRGALVYIVFNRSGIGHMGMICRSILEKSTFILPGRLSCF